MRREVSLSILRGRGVRLLVSKMGLLNQKLISEMTSLPKTRKRKNPKIRGERKKKRKQKPKQTKYRAYIVSKEWRAKCHWFMKRYGRNCVACGSKERLHVHHMTYRNLGHEKDEDLAVLCAPCHDEFHVGTPPKLDMVDETVAFILEKTST